MLIGLNGQAGSGKDTACGFMLEWAEAHGYKARRRAFADLLKLSAARLFWPDIGLEGAIEWCNVFKSHGRMGVDIPGDDDFALSGYMSGRTFFQRYGTEAHRDVFGHDFWIEAALRDYDPDKILVVPDVRFVNEAEAIRQRGGQVWLIERHDDSTDTHSSERPLPENLIDKSITNDAGLDDLRLKMRVLMDWETV